MKFRSHHSRLFMRSALVLMALSTSVFAKGKEDIVIMTNGDRMTGEIKSLEHGELLFKSDYMIDSAHLDWGRVAQLESKEPFVVLLTNGSVFTANIKLNAAIGRSECFEIESGTALVRVRQTDVLKIRPAEQRFWTRLDGSISYGFSYTSGNSQYETQLAAAAIYNGEGFVAAGDMSSVFSGQSGGSSTRRNTFDAKYWRLFTQKWFYGGLVELLNSDQQSLTLRTTVGGLVGRSLVQTDRTSLSAFSGVAFTRERYSSDQPQPHTKTAESLVGLNFTTFRFRKLDIDSRFLVWPSLTDTGRVRMGLNSNFRIELVKDLFWNLNLYENFDSRPPVNAKRNDLGITTSFGWTF